MIIRFHRLFRKQYKKLPRVLQLKADIAIHKFEKNPHDQILRNHALIGALIGLRSISATGDVRIIYSMEGEHAVVIFLHIGTHAQLYG